MKKLDHIGIVVKDIDKAMKLYQDVLHLDPWGPGVLTLNGMGIKMVLLPAGDASIQLLEPLTNEGRIANHLREKGEGPLQLNIFTDDFDAEVNELKKKGYTVELESTDQLFPGSTIKMAWLSPEEMTGMWIELIDSSSLPSVQ